MTGVEGQPYGPTGVTLDEMPEHQRVVFTETLRGWFDQLRRLPPPDANAVSGFMGTSVYSYRVWDCRAVGPFASQDEFHAQYFCQPWEPYDNGLRAALQKRANTQYKICFTHEDITPHNILVDGDLPCELIDWWEYTRALYARERYIGWKKVFTDIFPQYKAELTVERAIWNYHAP